MLFPARSPCIWKFRGRSLALGRRTQIVGVINGTPDSFSDGGRFSSPQAAIECALEMFDQGAAVVDVGGESTRPGERALVSAAEEIDRIVPVLEGILRRRPEALLSADTYKAETAQAALRAGAVIINDVSGLLWDPAMAGVCASAACGLVLMHTRGRPGEWQSQPRLRMEEVMPLVEDGLKGRLESALAAGVNLENIVLDPGFGFGKAGRENYALLAGLNRLRRLGRPLLAGLSRKSFLGRTLAPFYGGQAAPVTSRDTASVAAATAAVLAGADLLRVHEVRSSLEAAAVADAILGAGME